MLGTLVDTGDSVSATSHSQSDRMEAIDQAALAAGQSIDRDQLGVYLRNKNAIDAEWAAAGDGCTLAQAIELWSEQVRTRQAPLTLASQRRESGTSGSAQRSRSYQSRTVYSRDRSFGWRIRRAFGRR